MTKEWNVAFIAAGFLTLAIAFVGAVEVVI